jgi:preprotein translocase subunit YajC
MTNLSLLLAQNAPASASGAQTFLSMLPMILIFGAMYFLMIAPQRKKQKEHEKMMAALQTGDEVITTGGIYGTISNVKDDRFVIRVGEGQKLEVGKAFIQSCVKKANAS